MTKTTKKQSIEIPQGLKFMCKKSLKNKLTEGDYYFFDKHRVDGGFVLVHEDLSSQVSLSKSQVSRYLKQIKNFPITPELDKHLKERFSKADYKIVYLTLSMFNAIYTIEDFVDEDTGEVVTITREQLFNTKKRFYAKKHHHRWSNFLTRKQYLYHKDKYNRD